MNVDNTRVKVRFNVTRKVQDDEGQVFEEGRVYDLSETSANRWIRRGLAEAVTETRSKPGPKPKSKDE